MDIILTLLLAVIVIGIVYWIITLLPLPPPMRQIAQVLLALFLLLWVLQLAGVFGVPWRVRLG